MMSTTRQRPSVRLLRGVAVATIAGLTLATVPTVVAASPSTVQAPLVSQTVVGLRQGATGADVVALQNALIDAGVTVPGGADGFFGPATKSALTAYQSRSGLATTGEVDEASAVGLGLAAATTAPAASSGLTVGAQGDPVKELQNALMSFGVFVPGGADGVFGPATKTAVSNFQRWNDLAVTGEVDALTASKLRLGSDTAAPAAPAGVAAPAATNSTFVGMTVGARGENVKVLQRALIATGITVRGGADGVFGPMTAAALTSYQQANGLTANGVVDDTIVAALALAAGAPATAPASTPTPTPTPTPTAGASYVGLTVGANGALVKDLQRALMQTGLALRGGADGVFGDATKATLALFQKSQGREESGVVTDADAGDLALGTPTIPQGISSQPGFAVFGERGDRVTALQQSLIGAGISFAGGADGVFGAATAGAILTFQRREGLPATGGLDQATADRLGSVPAPAPAPPSSDGVSIDVFPVQGKCWFGDTWLAPRGGGRMHQGVDVIAGRGNLLYAVVTGTVSKIYIDTPGSLAGNGLRIAQDSGTYFTYLHMDTLAEGITVGAGVTAGQVIGTVGSTGNSATPHLHFEVHPNGGAAVNPYPLIKSIDACSVTAARA